MASVVAVVVAVLPLQPVFAPAVSAVTTGGPLILDGTDAGLHGSHSGGTPQGTWLYASKAYSALLGSATAGTAGSIAVLGAADSTASSNNCGAMAHYASAHAGATATYYDGVAGIDAFFAALASGAVTPRVVHIVEGSFCQNGLSSAEDAQLTTYAGALADFVNAGGGLYAQYHSYGWLTSLLPAVTFVRPGAGSSPILTDAGRATLPGLTDADIRAPWHGYFTGDFTVLSVLAAEAGKNVIIGGASVTLPSSLGASASADLVATGAQVAITATVEDTTGAPLPGVTVNFEVTAGPNDGVTGTATSDSAGLATFAYTGGPATGTDTVTVTATIGGSVKSTSVDVGWASAPGTPANVTATPGNGEATVSFDAPSSTGNSPITGYRVTASPGGATATGASSPIHVTGLANGTAYTFTVVAENTIGGGAASPASPAVTPAGPPSPPTITGVRPLNAALEVSFAAGSDGGRPITSYTVTVEPGGVSTTAAASPVVVSGLTNATPYTVTVTATNAVGTSSASPASTAVAPVAHTVPGPVPGLTAKATATTASVSWTAPASDGGAPITGYLVEHREIGADTWVAAGEVGTTSLELRGLDPNTPHEVRVAASNVAGPGAWTTSSFVTLGFPATGALTAVVLVDGKPVKPPLYTGPMVAAAVSAAGTPSGDGSWTTTAEGHVYTAGDAAFHGALGETRLNAPITGITPTLSGRGYYLVAADGGVFAFGDAAFEGSMSGAPLNHPVEALVPSCTGEGYYLVAGDGGVFAFDAPFHGSMSGSPLNKGMLGIVPNCELGGYWTFAADGGVFAFGSNAFYGSLGASPPASGVAAMRVMTDSRGYWLITGDGATFPFGSAAAKR